MKVVLVAGEPATGKTTLARSVMKSLGFGTPFKSGLVVGTRHPTPRGGSTYVLGIYGAGEGFWGTDRLSMALLPSLKAWMTRLNDDDAVFMEGDRVTSKTFAKHLCESYETTVIVLTAAEGTLQKRQKVRGNLQSPTFLKGRRTKINNLVEACPTKVFHETETEKISAFILDKLGASKEKGRFSADLER